MPVVPISVRVEHGISGLMHTDDTIHHYPLAADAVAMSSPRYFSGSYAQARQRFCDTARGQGRCVESHLLDGLLGPYGEALAIDVVRLGPSDARRLLIVTSGTHGPEGFAGSACQLAVLQDEALQARAAQAGVAILLVHAVNPHGFAHLRRVNEDNVDLNRNFIDFGQALPVNARYDELAGHLVPEAWPPADVHERAIADYIERHGMRGYREAVSAGQYSVPGGLFYGGNRPTWSNRTMRAIVSAHGASAAYIGWIDIHTGLGPRGHGEKIYPGRNDPQEVARARRWWGADVLTMFDGASASVNVAGPLVSCVYDECPQAAAALMGLEFGTLPQEGVKRALRADHWLHLNPDAPAAQAQAIRQDLRDAFYCDDDAWKGMVLGQTRVVLLQTIQGLADDA